VTRDWRPGGTVKQESSRVQKFKSLREEEKDNAETQSALRSAEKRDPRPTLRKRGWGTHEEERKRL